MKAALSTLFCFVPLIFAWSVGAVKQCSKDQKVLYGIVEVNEGCHEGCANFERTCPGYKCICVFKKDGKCLLNVKKMHRFSIEGCDTLKDRPYHSANFFDFVTVNAPGPEEPPMPWTASPTEVRRNETSPSPVPETSPVAVVTVEETHEAVTRESPPVRPEQEPVEPQVKEVPHETPVAESPQPSVEPIVPTESPPKPIPEASPEPIPEASPEPIPEASPEPIPEAIPEPIPEASPVLVPEEIPETSPDTHVSVVPASSSPAAHVAVTPESPPPAVNETAVPSPVVPETVTAEPPTEAVPSEPKKSPISEPPGAAGPEEAPANQRKSTTNVLKATETATLKKTKQVQEKINDVKKVAKLTQKNEDPKLLTTAVVKKENFGRIYESNYGDLSVEDFVERRIREGNSVGKSEEASFAVTREMVVAGKKWNSELQLVL